MDRSNRMIELGLRQELGLCPKEVFLRNLHFPASYAKRLRMEHVLEGHTGCVNRLAWNEMGDRLASGSDDRKILIWSVPEFGLPPLAITTQHRANIFGVQFLPCSNNTKLVSAAMDHTVQLHSLDHAELDAWRTKPGEAGQGQGRSRAFAASQCTSRVFHCHTNRVKDVKVEPLNPHNFWSAGEDGMVRQFDTRISRQDTHEAANVLLSLSDGCGSLELKSLDINKAQPHLLAVGCGDPHVRVYDRRKLTLSAPPPRASGCLGTPLAKLAPAHLTCGSIHRSRSNSAHCTYVNFSTRGDRLVCTYNGDNAYTFDTSASLCDAGAAPVATFAKGGLGSSAALPTQPQQKRPRNLLYAFRNASRAPLAAVAPSEASGSGSGGGSSGGDSGALPEGAEKARRRGNQAIFDEDWPAAVEALDRALQLAPWSTGLRAQRAEALLGRDWRGDALCALQDCEEALAPNPAACPTAHLRRVRALKALKQLQCARLAADEYVRLFPDRAHTEELLNLLELLDKSFRQRDKQREQWMRQRKHNRQMRKEAQKSIREGRSTPRPEARPAPAAADPRQPDAATGARADAPASPTSSASAAEGAGAGSSTPGSSTPGRHVVSYSASASPAASPAAANAAASPAAAAPPAATAGLWDSSSDDGSGDEDAAEDDPSREPLLVYYRNLASQPGSGSGSGSGSGASGADFDSRGLHAALHGRVLQRFMGHINVNTDIKEAVFVGRGDKLVACGSDDGRVYIYCAETGVLLRALQADEDVANCVQAHPSCALLATSGIETVIRIWSPGPEPSGQQAEALREMVATNQNRNRDNSPGLRTSHLRALADSPHLYNMLLSQLSGHRGGDGAADGEADDEDEGDQRAEVSCRVN